MSNAHHIIELEKQVALLEEKMKTHGAKIDSTLNALRSDMERTLREGMSSHTKWIIGALEP